VIPKFRVWCKNNREWETHEVLMNQDGILFHVKLGGAFLPLNPDTHIPVFFTGLKDKNGKEIYEGDRVRALKHNESPFVNEIVWRDGVLWFGNWNWIEFQNIFRSIEIIGNIYENPNLLESEV